MTTAPSTQETPTQRSQTDRWLDRQVISWISGLTIEKLLVSLIIILTILSRFIAVDQRTMSHDEINHVWPAYNFNSYVYNPVTHGPFQFHMLALSYAIFGDSDFAARVPAATFGVAIVIFTLLAWKRYLGRIGAIVAGFMMMISPYILFYSRYTRNEVFIVFWGLTMLWLFLRYIEGGEPKWLLWLAVVTGFHYADKATSYIFTAEACIFLAVLFLFDSLKQNWSKEKYKRQFVLGFELVILAVVFFGAIYILHGNARQAETAAANLAGATAGSGTIAPSSSLMASSLPLLIAILPLLGAIVYALIGLIKGLGDQVRQMRSFNLIALQLLLALPLFGAIIIKVMGYSPEDYSSAGIVRAASIFTVLLLISIFLGLKWWRSIYWKAAAIFWTIFVLLYSTMFTQGQGFFIGLTGALGYWMDQQAVQRGTQPLYFYAFVQIPIYEYLPAIGALTAFIIAIKKKLLFSLTGSPYMALVAKPQAVEGETTSETNAETAPSDKLSSNTDETEPIVLMKAGPATGIEDVSTTERTKTDSFFDRHFPEPFLDLEPAETLPTIFLLLYWSLMSLLAFTAAGEKMSWLTTHITLPLILSSGWSIGWLTEHFNWEEAKSKRGWLVYGLLLGFIIALAALLGSLFGNNPPSLGKELVQLQATANFFVAFLGTLGFGLGLRKALKGWQGKQFGRLFLLGFFSILALLTFRTAWRAAYIEYNNAKEFIVYAHSTEDMKNLYEELATLSKRTSGDLSLKIAYDDDVRYPMQWYTRGFTNRYDFDKEITKTLRDYPVIMVGDKNFDKIKQVVGDEYYEYTYHRMWWPMEEYRIWNANTILGAITNPAMRSALWQIWYNRDYTEYSRVTGKTDLTLATWSPSALMRVYIKKDLAAKVWELGAAPQASAPAKEDPYKAGTISLNPIQIVANLNGKPFNAPRGLAAAADGSLFVTDSRNQQIVHFSADGQFINAWGTPSAAMDINSPDGSFSEPWGVAIAADGKVFVTDTWNHRIQVFNPDGSFVRKWAVFNVDGTPDSFWGPRGIAIDQAGKVYVTDTGKQRVVVFDQEGHYITQFGIRGMDSGQLDEPVGIAIASDGRVFIADTWNNRISIFKPSGDYFVADRTFDVNAWTSQSLDDKPFIALDANDDIFVTDPAGGRVLHFDKDGKFIQLWGGFENEYLMGTINGVAIDKDGMLWVSDSTNNAVLKFDPPDKQPSK